MKIINVREFLIGENTVVTTGTSCLTRNQVVLIGEDNTIYSMIGIKIGEISNEDLNVLINEKYFVFYKSKTIISLE